MVPESPQRIATKETSVTTARRPPMARPTVPETKRFKSSAMR